MFSKNIYHKVHSDHAYLVDIETVCIKIKTKKGECQNVKLVYIDKYKYLFNYSDYFHDTFHELEMDKVASDDLYDYFETSLNSKIIAMSYYFKVSVEKQEHCYGNYDFFDENTLNPSNLFSFNFTVNLDIHKIPEWFKKSIVYQIFPDTFNKSEKSHASYEGLEIEPWTGKKSYKQYLEGKKYLGGNILGITEKLDYLSDLGINTVYLSPIFKSNSNHRYHTSDFFNIDPSLGTKEEFRELVNKAHKKNIRIILDLVLHASSTDFEYFQDVVKKGKDSKYKSWYHIYSFPVKIKNPPNYLAWSYLQQMPKFNYENKDLVRYLLSAVKYWITEFDIDGWRFDSAEETPFYFWREVRKTVKEAKNDAVMVAEIWGDASPWLQGDQFDSVKNYIFREAVTQFFAVRSINKNKFFDKLGFTRGIYKKEVFNVLWNLLDTHDTDRFIKECNGRKKRLKLAFVFLFTFPGVPYLYYGDELGMNANARDGMNWNKETQDLRLLEFVKILIKLRKSRKELYDGDFKVSEVGKNLAGVISYERTYNKNKILVIINNTDEAYELKLDSSYTDLITQNKISGNLKLKANSFFILDS